MGTDSKNTTVNRGRTAGATRFTPARVPAGSGDTPAAVAMQAAVQDVATTVVRRFRRGRWTVTTLPV